MSENTNEPKPKKVITPELREKMNAGRKRAMEERKKKKEAEKLVLKKEIKAMEKEKKKVLDKELEGLRQQKDAMETKKKTMEHRKEFRNRMRSKSVAVDDEDAQAEQTDESSETVEHSVSFETEVQDLLQRSPSPVEPVTFRQAEQTQTSQLDEEKIFKSQVEALSHNAKPETKKLFKQVTGKYDNTVSISDNLRNMSEEIKKLISSNVKQIKKNNEVIEAAEAKEEIIDKSLEEVKLEQKYKSQLSNLMRLR